MSGAYTAVPADTPDVDYPPEWHAPNWVTTLVHNIVTGEFVEQPYPGPGDSDKSGYPGPPFPPGYEPDYSATLTADAAIIVGNPLTAVKLSVNDYTSYRTCEPDGPVVWEASVDGVAVRLKVR